jgi:ribonuclease P protein component
MHSPGTTTPDRECVAASAANARGRLRTHADYQRVYKAARKQFSASMTWFVAARPAVAPSKWIADVTADPAAGPRVGLTAGKVLGKAHERNRIKRRMREVVRKHLHALPAGVDLILHPKRTVLTMEFGKLDAEVLRIFRQAGGQVGEARTKPAGATQPRPMELVAKAGAGKAALLKAELKA